MELDGSHIITADRATVWARLNDPAALQAAIPGCTELTGDFTQGFAVTVVLKIGPMKSTIRGNVALSDVVPGQGYRMTGEGRAGMLGGASGQADLHLSDAPEGTRVDYRLTAELGGGLAKFGARMLGDYARTLAGLFLDRLVWGPGGKPEGATDPNTSDAAP